MLSRLTALSLRRVKCYPTAFSTGSSGCSLTVVHDRHNQRFTVTPESGTGANACAVLNYKFTGEKEVDLMSTYVPETFRGQGVAAVLSQMYCTSRVSLMLELLKRMQNHCFTFTGGPVQKGLATFLVPSH
ncbi:hypothetical protein INR49_005481, partial [Caranx melampygus]